MVFVAQSLQAMVLAITNCQTNIPLEYLIIGQVLIFVPLAMIRKIQKLSFFALIADAFILVGLAYLYYYDFLTLALNGVGKVEWIINPTSFPMFIGTAVFTFEGVGLSKCLYYIDFISNIICSYSHHRINERTQKVSQSTLLDHAFHHRTFRLCRFSFLFGIW